MIGAGEPMIEILPRHPPAPADLKPLIEIELIHRKHDIGGRQHAEEQQLVHECIPVALLQRIVEAVVPLVEHDVDGHDRELDRDHRADRIRPARRSSE